MLLSFVLICIFHSSVVSLSISPPLLHIPTPLLTLILFIYIYLIYLPLSVIPTVPTESESCLYLFNPYFITYLFTVVLLLTKGLAIRKTATCLGLLEDA